MTEHRAMPRPAASVVPYLFYDDVERAAHFIEKAFGFTRTFSSPAPEGGLAHAQLTLGPGLVMLGHAGGGGLGMVKSAGSLGALHAGVYVFVDDVDKHCEHARAGGAKVLLEPADQPWGDRMYCAVDPEGQFWMFAKRLALA
jgi:PhnB protein